MSTDGKLRRTKKNSASLGPMNVRRFVREHRVLVEVDVQERSQSNIHTVYACISYKCVFVYVLIPSLMNFFSMLTQTHTCTPRKSDRRKIIFVAKFIVIREEIFRLEENVL